MTSPTTPETSDGPLTGYDTTRLLGLVDRIRELPTHRDFNRTTFPDDLLKLHGMAHHVINGSPWAGVAGRALPELASELRVQLDVLDARRDLEGVIPLLIAALDPLVQSAAEA